MEFIIHLTFVDRIRNTGCPKIMDEFQWYIKTMVSMIYCGGFRDRMNGKVLVILNVMVYFQSIFNLTYYFYAGMHI